MRDLTLVASLFGPLFAGLVFHGLCIRFGWLGALAYPIDRGALLHGKPLFGANKTYRGVLAVALGAAAGYAAFPPVALQHLSRLAIASIGFALGAAAMLSELPNSVVKRQLGIAPGTPGRGLASALFYLLDQVDLLLGAWLVAWTWVPPTLPRVLWSILFVVIVHQAVSILGALLGMRTSAR